MLRQLAFCAFTVTDQFFSPSVQHLLCANSSS
jgi:hypothetical protein